MANRVYDIIVWGATGFTGSLVAEYLAKNAPVGIKWAIAGRNFAKLDNIKQGLVVLNPKLKDLSILLAEIKDQPSIDEIVKQTKVVLSTAGPFFLYGTPIVAACAKFGTHYCDITGEVQWVKKLILNFEEEAQKTGAIIVNCCGHDCIPSDLGTFVLASFVKDNYGVGLKKVDAFVTKIKGGTSGGTIASICEAMSDKSSALKDPYSLFHNPPRHVKQPRDQMLVSYDSEMKLWKFPYPLGIADNRIVRKSQELMGYPFGQFAFGIACATPSFVKAFIAWFVMVGVMIFLQFRIGRWIVSKIAPPGSGPKRENFLKGCVELTFIAETEDNRKQGVPRYVTSKVAAIGDPGYYLTSKMLAESALCLATQTNQIPAKKGGIYTPAASMGNALVERMKKIGFNFEVFGPYNP